VRRPLGTAALALAAVAAALAAVVRSTRVLSGRTVDGVAVEPVALAALLAAAVALATYGLYRLVLRTVVGGMVDRRRAHDTRNLLRLGFAVAGAVGVLGAVTEQWVGVLVSLGVVGVAVTVALQQPLLSVVAWAYVMVARPFEVGDRVEVGDARGDVISVGFLVTTLWEIDGPLVATNQPSGRVVTVPNALVLSAEVTNYGGAGIPHVWNEVSVQVAYETDLAFARERMTAVADDLLGDQMAARVAEYREALAETPVELEVNDRPTVNVRQRESWVELRLRYLVHPRRATRVRNTLYERILAEFNDAPDRVSFPVSRNR
jgi:small-conductance mechanosensitive channel